MSAGLLTGAGALGSVLSGVIGNAASQGSTNSANNAVQQALTDIQNINSPTAQALQLALQQESSAGNLNPKLEGTVNQGSSAMQNITTDPRLAAAQMQSLQSLQRQGQGGLNASDLVALSQARNSANQQAQAGEQSILQNMQQRGEGGSGAELAAALSNSQNAANQANNADLQTGASAAQRALQAMAQAGQLGGQMQATSFNQQAQQAAAQDAINRYNAANQQQVLGNNISSQNAAQQYNLANAQNISNANTGIANQQTTYNSQMEQQAYNDAMQQAQAEANAEYQSANNYNKAASNTQTMASGIGNSLSQAGTALGTQANNQNSTQSLLNAINNMYGSTPPNSSTNGITS